MFSGFDRHTTSEHLLSSIVDKLSIKGNNVHILQKDTGGTLPNIPENISQINVSSEEVPFQPARKNNFIARYLKEIQYINKCIKTITKEYDAVFIQSTTVLGIAVEKIKRVLPNAIITINIQDIFPYNAVYGGKMRFSSVLFRSLSYIQRKAYKKADHIITISEDMKELLIKDGTESNKIEVIYNWSYQDDPYTDVDVSSVSHMLGKNTYNVVYAGNIGVMQNVDIIIDAAEFLKEEKDILFHIIGDGVYKEKLEIDAKKRGITNIRFWPMQSSDLAPAIYSSADINIIPLIKDVYRTALPSKTATCFACGKPVIFAIGENSKFGKKVKKETGCPIVESDSAKSLAKYILKVRDNNETFNTKDFFIQYMNKTNNSNHYAKIITTNPIKEKR